ncbi:cysteine-rich small domain-containing protein [Desulfoplanes formicivorans]|uniref:Cysteine-rich small domain-containing protein n=1 Tax=Desulfoplanes formicivorans TaxID=1592317 RepID=A0A194AKG9_9BACT|nr:cysteine-rich small domain-containing protein [Desulfoplanes formicivorans]GAU09551.1 hypothetical protein DPF_2279 [Desulfoplanes formicivorans]
MNKSDHHAVGDDRFCQNLNCPFFPCHQGADPQTFNCKHCYCPLYFIYWDNCGGNFTMLENGIKDCSGCLVPHACGGHEYVVGKLMEYFEQVRGQKGTRQTGEKETVSGDGQG